jgi:hypothetical protein
MISPIALFMATQRRIAQRRQFGDHLLSVCAAISHPSKPPFPSELSVFRGLVLLARLARSMQETDRLVAY